MHKKRDNKWLKTALSVSFFLLFLVASCASNKSDSTKAQLQRLALKQKVELLEAAGEPVLVVGGESISSDDIINSPVELGQRFISPMEYLKPIAQTSNFEQFKEQARDPLETALSIEISDILFYQMAKSQIAEAEKVDEALEKAAEMELRRFILDYDGDQAKADEALKQMGMDRRSFKERQKRLMLTQSYIATQFPDYKGPISYRELKACYEKMKEESFVKPATIQLRLIDIQIDKLRLSDPNQSQLEEARKLAGELVGRIRAGEDFGELALAYSHGHRQAFGGLWKPMNPDSLAEPYDVLAVEAEKLKPGQIAGPIEAPGHIFIMKLEEKHSKDYEPFEKVQQQVQQRVVVDRQREVIKELNAKVMQQKELEEKDKFIDFCIQKVYQKSNQ
jgi:parvulin-like peptidyl-prolyl isomerase